MTTMKILLGTAAVVAIGAALAGPVEAKGCLKGAVVGGIAGHMVGHGGVGAAAGCAVGSHRANKRAAQQGTNAAPAPTPLGSSPRPA